MLNTQEKVTFTISWVRYECNISNTKKCSTANCSWEYTTDLQKSTQSLLTKIESLKQLPSVSYYKEGQGGKE